MSLDGVAFVSSRFFFGGARVVFLHQRFQNPRTDHHALTEISSLFVGALTMDTACSALCGVPVATLRDGEGVGGVWFLPKRN